MNLFDVSFKQISEHIVKADIILKNDGTKPTAEEIFNYSPTGELYMIIDWYRIAIKKLGCFANGKKLTNDEMKLIDKALGITNGE